MKRIIKYLMGITLFALIVAGIGSACQSCEHRPRIPIDDEEFKEKLDQYLPEAMQKVYAFEDVTDVMLYKQERNAQAYVDSTFLAMTDQEVANVVSVLKKQQDTFGVSDIVYEYNANRRIYSNLPTSTPSTTDPPAEVKSEQPDPPVAETKEDSTVKITHVPLKK